MTRHRCPDDPWEGVGPVAETWGEHLSCWRDCLRCKNADARLLIDASKRKTANRVPMASCLRDQKRSTDLQRQAASLTAHGNVEFAVIPEPGQADLLVLLPYPDVNQEAASSIWGNGVSGDGSKESTSLLTVQDGLMWACEYLGLSLDEVSARTAVASALSCRPADWTDRSKVVDPSPEMINACRPKLLREIARIRPKYIVALGHAAFCAMTSRVTVTKYNSMIGTVAYLTIPLAAESGKGSVRIPVYVGPDPNAVFTHASVEAWEEVWDGRPAELPAREPVRNFRWHMRVALTLDVIARAKSPTDRGGWGYSSDGASTLLHEMSGIMGEFYDRIQEARSADALALRTHNIHLEDQGGHASALFQMIFGDVSPSTTTLAEVEEEDDLDGEPDDEEDGEEEGEE